MDVRAEMQVWVEDEAGALVRWGGGTEPATHGIKFTPNPASFAAAWGKTWLASEWARTVTLPAVALAHDGDYAVVAQLVASAASGSPLGVIRLPVCVRVPADGADRPGRDGAPPGSLAGVTEELGDRLGAEGRRLLRLAATEAQRLCAPGGVNLNHLVIALRRRLGAASGLPGVKQLREASEQADGVAFPSAEPRRTFVTPGLVRLLRTVADRTPGAVDAAVLVETLAAGGNLAELELVEEARRLARRPPF